MWLQHQQVNIFPLSWIAIHSYSKLLSVMEVITLQLIFNKRLFLFCTWQNNWKIHLRIWKGTEQLKDSSENLKRYSHLILPLNILKLQHSVHLSRNLLQVIKSLHIFYQRHQIADVFCKYFFVNLRVII